MKLEAKTRLLAGNLEEVQQKLREQAQKMDQVDRNSAEYKLMQKEMQKLLKQKHALDPEGASPFDFNVWTHSGKPRRTSRGLSARADEPMIAQPHAEYADTEDPLSDGAAFDTLIDGEPDAAEPAVQRTTKDDGGVETAPEQSLLNDDLVPPSITFG